MSEPSQPAGEPALQYSVAVRIRRTVTEEVHVLVPVTDAVVTGDHLDGEKIFAEALRIGAAQHHEWRREGEPTVEIHPLQTPPPHAAADRA